jgi:hypothetical protein
MQTTNSNNKLPFVLAASAIGGAAGYLFFTDSGKHVLDSVKRFRLETTASLPDKIEHARQLVEKRGEDVTSKVRGVVDRIKESIDAGQLAYTAAEMSNQVELRRLQNSNQEVMANLHRAVDNLGRLMNTAQEAVMSPVLEVGALAKGVSGGVRHLARRASPENENDRTYYRDEQRLMG